MAPIDVVPLCEENRGDKYAGDSTVTRHAAFPDSQNTPKRRSRRKVRQQIRTVEESVADTPTDHRSENNVGDEVGDQIGSERPTATERYKSHDERAQNEAGEVRETVPTDAHVFGELQKERIEVVNPNCLSHMPCMLMQPLRKDK